MSRLSDLAAEADAAEDEENGYGWAEQIMDEPVN